MGRPRIPLGSWGAIRCDRLTDGRYKARGTFRELSGQKADHSAIAESPSAAEELLRARAAIRSIDGSWIGPDSSVLETSRWWLEGLHLSGRLAAGTIDNYEQNARQVNKVLGSASLRELTVAVVDRVIRNLAETDARLAVRVRKTLKQMLDEAVRVGAMRSNPTNAVRAPRVPTALPYALTAAQAQFVRESYRGWMATRQKPGPAPDPRVADMLDVLLGLGIRIGELLALRHCDIDLAADAPRLLVAATLVDGPKGEPLWQPHPKSKRQRRALLLPELAAEALRRHVDPTQGTRPVFANRNGVWLRPGNVRRILRSFRDEWSEQLEWQGIDHDRFTPHLFRRTLATLIATEAGVDRAREQLGHASVTTTERHYVTPPPVVGQTVVEYIDSIFPSKRDPASPHLAHDVGPDQ